MACTRWPLTPKYYYHFDNVNFALALEKFDPAYHRPHLPGYPFFVGVARSLLEVLPRKRQALLATGILGAAAAVFLAWWLGERMFGAKAGFVAALLLAFNPPFWLAGTVTQVRVFLATVSLAVALAAWRVWQGQGSTKGFYVLSSVLGFGCGFRPSLLLFLFPLLLAAGLKRKLRLREFLLGGGLLTLGVLSWFVPLLIAIGGPGRLFEQLGYYVPPQYRDTLVLMGGWKGMALAAVVWNGLGALAWIWALPLALRRGAPGEWRATAVFLAVWFLPGFLFQCFVHVGDADQTLGTIPVLCLVGGWALSHFRAPVWMLAGGVNALLFLSPPDMALAQRSGHETIRHFDRSITPVIDAVHELRSQGPLFIISSQFGVSWRHLSYYFPNDPLLFFHGDAQSDVDSRDAWIMRQRDVETVVKPGWEVVLPGQGKVVFLPPWPPDLEALRQAGFRQHGPVLVADATPSVRFRVGRYRFSSGQTTAYVLRPVEESGAEGATR